MFILPLAASEGVSMAAEPMIDSIPWLTSSVFVTVIVTIALLIVCRRATSKMQLVPVGGQNLFEAIVEGLYDMFEGVVGKHMIHKCFSLFATLFIFILASNWFGLLPGVGTIGFGDNPGPWHSLKAVDHPILRPGSADLNMTLALALLFMVMWLIWTVQEVGAGAFILHLFAPKGGTSGVLWFCLLPLFIFVGLIEIVSIIFRPVSLSLRLYGNIFAGENLLHTMGSLGDKLPPFVSSMLSVLLPLPFYFLELLVGILQALVFTLLCAVYLQLSTSHDDEEDHHPKKHAH